MFQFSIEFIISIYDHFLQTITPVHRRMTIWCLMANPLSMAIFWCPHWVISATALQTISIIKKATSSILWIRHRWAAGLWNIFPGTDTPRQRIFWRCIAPVKAATALQTRPEFSLQVCENMHKYSIVKICTNSYLKVVNGYICSMIAYLDYIKWWFGTIYDFFSWFTMWL